MKKYILLCIVLLTVLLYTCSSKDQWQPSEKEKEVLLDTLKKISLETDYLDSDYSIIDLYWVHPEVAILYFKATISPDSIGQLLREDTIKTVTTSVFVLSDEGWELKRSFGTFQKK